MRIDVHHHTDPPPSAEYLDTLFLILKRITQMSKVLDDLTAAVAANVTVTDSAITLLQGLAAALAAAVASGDTAAISQLAADLQTETEKLAGAVTANTPAV